MPQRSPFKQSHHQQQQFHHQSPPVLQEIQEAQLQRHRRSERQRHHCHHYGLSLLALPVLAIFLAQCSSSTALVVPNELPSILSLVYSNIPPIKKGTDSRLGFGFRLGNHADFQVMVELGPQKETRPIGDQDSGSSFNKRQVNRQQQRAVQRDAIRAEQKPHREVAKPEATPSATNSWLEKWASQVNDATTAKKKVAPKPKPYKKQVTPKPAQIVPVMPQQMQAIQQLQMLYKMATTTTNENLASTTTTTTTTVAPDAADRAMQNIQQRLQLYKPPADLEELQVLMQKSQAQSKAEITKELMDVNLDE
ncbi:uncharacterized protein LOC131803549 [Musca domestica]|uniref:Uncharacterized protein LOC131803549 n=1 Tax=Musca domestica TaxID=7370 RepID=A0ABM3V524_MUSDO|nr:uncharacterized protein LOC131803549 [Musca domestica]